MVQQKTDHLANIAPWLKTMGLRRCIPTLDDIEKKENHFEHIKPEQFKEAKRELLAYLKKNNTTVVRDHCHFTGKFRGAAHQTCNLNLRKRVIIPAFFHNFTGYDSHLLFKSLSSLKKQPQVLAKSLEKFTMMQIGNIEIKDSLNFMSCSLDKLVSNLNEKGKKENKSLQETFPIT